jgi:hypothetical protein
MNPALWHVCKHLLGQCFSTVNGPWRNSKDVDYAHYQISFQPKYMEGKRLGLYISKYGFVCPQQPAVAGELNPRPIFRYNTLQRQYELNNRVPGLRDEEA